MKKDLFNKWHNHTNENASIQFSVRIKEKYLIKINEIAEKYKLTRNRIINDLIEEALIFLEEKKQEKKE